MVQIEFDNNQAITVIQAKLEDLFKDVLSKYLGKTLLSPDSVCFLANGSIINPNLSVEKQMNNLDKANKSMKVIVNVMKEDEDDKAIIKSKQIICPECKEPCRIKLENYKIKLYDCIKGHVKENINLIDFNNTQQIDLSTIKCDKCDEKNKSNTFNNDFFVCLSCKQNLCPICKDKHEKKSKEHNIINYEQKFFICQEHNDFYIDYCQKCKTNLCTFCVREHKEHEKVAFTDLIPDIDGIKERLSEIKQNIELFNSKINIIIKQLKELMKAMEIYYDINIDILTNFSYKNRNYETLQNVNEISINNPIFELIKDINQNKNFSSKIFNIIDLYNRISLDKEELDNLDILKNEGKNNIKIPITLNQTENIVNQLKKSICKINKSIGIFTKIKYNDEIITLLITNEKVINNNKIKLKLYNNDIKCIKLDDKRIKYKYNNIEIIEIKEDIDKIYEYIEIDDNINNDKLYNNKNIYIIENNNNDVIISYNIYNNNLIYNNIFSLVLLIDNNKLIGINNENENILLLYIINKFIDENNKIKEQNNINKNKEKENKIIKDNNNTKLNEMTIIYNINIKDKIKLFGEDFVKNNKDKCYILIDIQKIELCDYYYLNNNQKNNNKLEIKLIETKSITNMSYMFYECTSLNSLPDISNWNTSNVTSMHSMFYQCISFNSFSDISKWDISNVTDMFCMFYDCTSLNSLPDISKWNTSNVTKMNSLFSFCTSLKSLPDISKWNTTNVTHICGMFNHCTSLNSLPDISKWNTSNVTNMSYMFSGCTSLNSLPDISKFNTSNVNYINNMFVACTSLNSLPDISKWNTINVTDMHYIFYECTSLNSLPNISNWNTSNVTDMCGMFSGCTSLNSLPDISKWNTSNVTNMCGMFDNCTSLNSLPDISKWNTTNVTDMRYMFKNCTSLNSFPLISKWKIKKLEDKEDMFYGCKEYIIPKKFKDNCLIF